MAVSLPQLVPLDFTSLDFQSIIDLVNTIIKEHPDYFSNVDDFLQSNAARETIELVAYIVDLLAERVDWVANELTLPTATQKQNLMNILKLINYRLLLPKSAAATITTSIISWVDPFVIPVRYRIPGKDLNGNTIYFELLNKDDVNKYIYEGIGSGYEFDTGFEIAPILSHNNLVFYEGTSYQEFFTMTGANNEFVQLSRVGVEEGSIRAWKITRDSNGNIITRRELTDVSSFISPEAQTASALSLPPFEIQNTQNNGAYLVFGESPVVAVFNSSGTDEIMVWYRTTNGSLGNITINSINFTTSLLVGGQNVQISFLNTTAGTGGQESETIDHAKRYGPLTLTTVEKTVNPQDFTILLQDLASLLNAVAYGKSNEPVGVFTDYGYYIPPYDVWIYPVMNKTGWENFPTYSYPVEMKVGRPWTLYGYLDSEKIIFDVDQKELMLLKYYAHNGTYSNLKVTDFYNQTIYTPGTDFVVDLEGRTITRLTTGTILSSDLVVVQYYENSHMDANYIQINFANSDSQNVPRSPIYPGLRTSAKLLDLSANLSENTLSESDYDWPTNDYYIDYENNLIIRNSNQPYLDGKISFGATRNLSNGINNHLVLNLSGLNAAVFNSDNDIMLDAYSGWGRVGRGLPVITVPSNVYSFKISVDGGPLREYRLTAPGSSWAMQDLAYQIATTAIEVSTSDPFSNSGAIVFADAYLFSASPILTFMSLTTGVISSIALASGTSFTDLFSFPDLDISSQYVAGVGEAVDAFEASFRLRCTFNTLGLCNNFAGQTLPAANEEKPEIYSNNNLPSVGTFSLTGANNQLSFGLTGTTAAAFDGTTQVTFVNTAANGPYNLTAYQGRLDLIRNMQNDIDGANGFNHGDVVQAVWLRSIGNYYRIGFRLIDTGSTTIAPTIKMLDDIGRIQFRFNVDQSSIDGNLLEAKISPTSDMVSNIFIRIQLLGAFGPAASLQVKSNNAIQNNTLTFLGMADQQFKRGSSILQRTLAALRNLLEITPGSYSYQIISTPGPAENDNFNLTITGTPAGFTDGDYGITLAAGTYNIAQLVSMINISFQTADFSGTPTNISSFLVCEKIESYPKIRFRMLNFSSTVIPDIQINTNVDLAINRLTIDTLGFIVNQRMSIASTIILHYAGDWLSDPNADTSEATSIVNSLQNNRLISQDYIIKDTLFTSFDVKGSVYVAKGFDRDLVKANSISNVQAAFRINQREFQTPVAITSITDVIGQTEGVEYLDIDYFGKDYQLYKKYIDSSKRASIAGSQPAENVVDRWVANSAFKITLDGCTISGINYDGEYLITVGNAWTDRNYSSLINAIENGDGTTGGLQHAISLRLGGVETDLTQAVHVLSNSGIINFYTQNSGPSVMLKLDDPDDILTRGYQTFSRTSLILESEYTPSATYSISININGAGAINYEITAPTSGIWNLSILAAQFVLPVSAIVGIDENGKIRITSLLGGFASTIAITAGITGTDLLTLIGPADVSVSGSSGYISCLMPSVANSGIANDGVLYITPSTAYGLADEPGSDKEYFNYKTKIVSKYNEILFLSDNYFVSGSTDVLDQRHGMILDFLEVGKDIV